MEKQIFKKGDKVFDYVSGWGEVIETNNVEFENYPLRVKFGEIIIRIYTFDGRIYEESPQTLSFTEYTLDGFSQERLIELPEIGEMVMVSDDEESWYYRRVKKIEDGKVCAMGNDWNHFKRLR